MPSCPYRYQVVGLMSSSSERGPPASSSATPPIARRGGPSGCVPRCSTVAGWSYRWGASAGLRRRAHSFFPLTSATCTGRSSGTLRRGRLDLGPGPGARRLQQRPGECRRSRPALVCADRQSLRQSPVPWQRTAPSRARSQPAQQPKSPLPGHGGGTCNHMCDNWPNLADQQNISNSNHW